MQFQEAKDFILQKLSLELPPELSYHSIRHSTDVYSACERIAAEEGVEGDDRLLLLTAALFHDAGFIFQSKDHETLSCNIAREFLPSFGYSATDVARICGMIMATKISQTPGNKLEEILCDADLDYLGREDFYQLSNMLFEEFCAEGAVNSKEEWNQVQLQFLSSHHYFTKTAIQLRKQKKDEHLHQIRATIETYS